MRPGGAVRAAVALIGVAVLGYAAASFAEGEPVSIGTPGAQPSDEAKSAARPLDERPPGLPLRVPAPKPPRSLFRCWQHGQVIFEGRGYSALPPSQVAADLKGSDGNGGRLQVLDMNQGLCILELPK